MTEYQDQSTELWHFWAWDSSIQTDRADNAYTSDENLLISDNIIQFAETERYIKECIIFISCDFWSETIVSDNVIITVQTVAVCHTLDMSEIDLSTCDDHKLFIIKNICIELETHNITHYLNIFINCHFSGSEKDNYIFSDKQYYIRYVVNTSQKIICLLCQLTFTWEKLEIDHFEREHIIKIFTSSFILSLSLILFVDNFDVYRNMYCTLKVFYWILINLSYEEWCKVINVFTLSLRSHEADIREIVEVFVKNINKLNVRYEIKINENTVTVIIFFMILIKDISQ